MRHMLSKWVFVEVLLAMPAISVAHDPAVYIDPDFGSAHLRYSLEALPTVGVKAWI